MTAPCSWDMSRVEYEAEETDQCELRYIVAIIKLHNIILYY